MLALELRVIVRYSLQTFWGTVIVECSQYLVDIMIPVSQDQPTTCTHESQLKFGNLASSSDARLRPFINLASRRFFLHRLATSLVVCRLFVSIIFQISTQLGFLPSTGTLLRPTENNVQSTSAVLEGGTSHTRSTYIQYT